MNRALVLIGLVVLGSLAEGQQTLRVPSVYGTIPLAMAAAGNGDTILVAPGTYRGGVNFGGKAVILRSQGGSAVTTLVGTSQQAAVVIESDGGRSATVDGFTITAGGKAGIYVKDASPTIVDCQIIRNTGVRWWSGSVVQNWHSVGGGIYCERSSARIERCYVLENRCSATGRYGGSGFASGGGIYATASAILVRDCYIGGNTVYAGYEVTGDGLAHGGGLFLGAGDVVVNSIVAWNRVATGGQTAKGGGIAASGSRIVNCNIWGNAAGRWPPADTAGTAGGSYTNCIVRRNTPLPQQAAGTFAHCNVEGGAPGIGNFDLDPRFADDHHLRWDSPCRDAGTIVPNLPARDFEGHPRVVDGKPDVGLDEFFVRLDLSGSARPGGQVTVRVRGEPGKRTHWALSTRALAPSIRLPGLQGLLVIDPARAAILDLGPLPPSGDLRFTIPIPNPFPVTTFTTQALVFDQLSLPRTVTVQ